MRKRTERRTALAQGNCPECGEVYAVEEPGPLRANGGEYERTGFTFPCRGCGTRISIQRDATLGLWLPYWSSAILEALEESDRLLKRAAA